MRCCVSCDGILFTGSPSNVEPHHYAGPPSAPGTLHDPHRDAITLPLIPAAVRAGVPVFGICRGFQEMNVAFGGTLHAEAARGAGLSGSSRRRARSRSKCSTVRRTTSCWSPAACCARLPGRIKHSSQFAALAGRRTAGPAIWLPKRARRTASSKPSACKDAPRFAVAVQWHPEWQVMSNSFSRALFAAFGDASRERARNR